MGEDGKIVYRVVVDSDGVVSDVSRAGREGGGAWEEIWTGVCRRVGEAFVNMAAKAGQAVSDFVADSIKTGMEFESGMSQIAATLGYSTDDIANNVSGAGDAFDALREKAIQMGSETNFTATEAAEGLNILAMSGYDAGQSMEMIEDVLHLAAAGSLDLASAAGYVSGAMKGFSDDTKDAAYYADLMAKGATLANTDVQQLGEAISGGAAVAASYGQSAESMTVALLRLAEQGETGTAAATALSAAMKNLYAPTDQAKELMEELGVSAFDTTTGAARDFNEIVNELNGVLSQYSDEQRTAAAQTIFGIQGFNAYNKMVVTSTNKQEEWAEALAHASGEAAQQYDTMTDNLQGDMDILNSALDGLKLAVYDEIQPALRDLVGFGTESLSEITTAFRQDGISGAIDAARGILRGIVDTFIEELPTLIDTGMSLIENLLLGLADGLPEAIPMAVTVITTIATGLLNHLPTIISAGIQVLLALVLGLTKAIPSLIGMLPVIISTIVNVLIQNLPQLLDAGIEILLALGRGLIQAIPQLLLMIPQIISDLVNAFKVTDWQNIGANIVNGIWEGIVALWDGLVNAVRDAVSNLIASAKQALGISSPSKKFKYIGEMTTEGTIEGIEDTEDEMTRTVRDVYEGMTDTANEALRPVGVDMNTRENIERDISVNMTATGTTPDMTIVVPLTLDGREIARATAWSMGEQLAWEEL